MRRPPFRRLLVANRGEIAIRVMRTCRELGVESVAVYSDADAGAPHVRYADAAERIGPPPATDSYLDIGAILDASERSSAEAIHPGYGFLSENVDFAEAVEAAGLVWIGPPPATLRGLGDKLAARRVADGARVPVVPGLLVPLGDGDPPPGLAGLGVPLLVKAAAGGGGRGMRRVDDLADLERALATARREALAAFGDPTVYAERLISPARHVEVQLLGDRHGGVVALGERDCSVQRRHQKLVEETPSPAVTRDARAALLESATRLAGVVEFHSAATAEFLLAPDGSHYFLEMNTRLQVEHGVTELVTGIDLVAWQLRVAAGERLPGTLRRARPRGHAIEVRVYAEDPWSDFRPVSGTIGAWRLPEGPGVRVDAAGEPDMPLATEYDPLLAKIMVHAGDRPAAVARLRRALDETLIGGVQTDLGFHRWLVDQPEFVDGGYDTGFVSRRWGSGAELDADDTPLMAAAALLARRAAEPDRQAALRAAANGRVTGIRGVREASGWIREARREAIERWR
jgi:acetyl-CoA/propionyl-CoA carboxylase biotin carboxyl carrier protein